jgi:hypothetical protein
VFGYTKSFYSKSFTATSFDILYNVNSKHIIFLYILKTVVKPRYLLPPAKCTLAHWVLEGVVEVS